MSPALRKAREGVESLEVPKCRQDAMWFSHFSRAPPGSVRSLDVVEGRSLDVVEGVQNAGSPGVAGVRPCRHRRGKNMMKLNT